ncbi:unnamed protein product [Caenorhabditis angaria]|uniref:PXA domain-containing protein n=1 Tax=Caenorhabditis angaria TaxID=860376 RepID=A0A9P1IEA4_9PELO|nr:unnamed protein product [Caenorhabditis angaria]
MDKFFTDERKIHISSAAVLIFVIFYGIIGFLPSLLIVASLFAGIAVSLWCFSSANGEMFDAWKTSLTSKLMSILPSTATSTSNSKIDFESEKTRRMPWEGLTLPSSLNESLENLLNEIVEQYFNWWYGRNISQDRAFLNEIRYQLRYSSANLVKCIRRIDLAEFVTEKALPISLFHVTRLDEMERKIKENGANCPRSMIESKMAEMLTDCHIALTNREQETEYLKQVADFLIPRLLDETRLAGRAHDDDSPFKIFGRSKNERPWPSKSVRNCMREMLTNAVLIPLLDMLSQPDTINYWLILLFDDNKQQQISDPVDLTEVQFLKGLSCDAIIDNVPDSLLQLKLSEILRDAKYYSIFRMYLQDIRGPVHELQFLAEATRIHESIQRKSEKASQIAYDIWQLYTQFIHESAQEKVILDEKLVAKYEEAVESKDIEILEGIIETSYQVVYNRMQTDHVISFCQSECFLGFLCGSPPITINELIDRDTQERRKHQPVEKTFSLSQLRARVRKALISDGDSEEEQQANTPESQSSSSTSSFVNVPSIDVISEEEGDIVQEESIAAEERCENVGGGLIMDADARDLNTWKVNVAKVAPLKDTYTDRTIYVFVIEVERPDAKPHETRSWSIHRSFNEFYVLESKLNVFHGDSLRFAALPIRKTFVTRNRPFMEQHRLIFSTFISTLCKQKVLNRSELLLTFLSSNEEFRDTLMLSDLNPWKVVKKMPGKLSREKGQNLKPYLLKTLANTLAPVILPSEEKVFDKTFSSDIQENGSIGSLGLTSPPINTVATNVIYSSVYGNNFGGIIDSEIARNNVIERSIWSKSSFDAILLLIWSTFSKFPYILNILSAIRTLCSTTINSTIRLIFDGVFQKCLRIENLVYLVQHIQYTLFNNDQPWPTEQEMKMREELAKRRTLEYFQNFINHRAERLIGREHIKDLVSRLLEGLQYPRMNKQLLYVILDQLLVDVFTELSEEGHHPLQ